MEGRASNAMLIHHFLVPSMPSASSKAQQTYYSNSNTTVSFPQEQKPLSPPVLLVSDIFKLKNYLDNSSRTD